MLKELTIENQQFKSLLELRFIGKTDAGIVQEIMNNELNDFLQLSSYVPHEDLPGIQHQAALLLLSINRIQNAPYILTGKVFEYLASRKPILAICPEESDVAAIIKETNTGWVVPFHNKEVLRQTILEAFDDYINNRSRFQPILLERYSRKSLTTALSEIMNKLVS